MIRLIARSFDREIARLGLAGQGDHLNCHLSTILNRAEPSEAAREPVSETPIVSRYGPGASASGRNATRRRRTPLLSGRVCPTTRRVAGLAAPDSSRISAARVSGGGASPPGKL